MMTGMDEHGHIYSASTDSIPDVDVARLQGYLKGRADADELQHVRDLGDLKREIEQLRAAQERGDGSAAA